MSQDPDSRKDHKSPENLLEEAKAHLNRVITIDPGNCIAHIFLDQVPTAEIPACSDTDLTLHQIALVQKRGSVDSDQDLSGDEVSSLTREYYIGNAPKRTKRGENIITQVVEQRYEPMPSSSTSDDRA